MNKQSIGECIIDAIVNNSLVGTTEKHGVLFVWSEKSTDVIGHAVHTYLQESEVVKQARALTSMIEALPASEAASHCSLAAANLARSLEGHWGPQPCNGLNFGQAIEALKVGKHVSRAGWNGKGMRLFLLPGNSVPKSAIHDPALRKLMDEEIKGDTFEALPSIRLFTADKKVLTGWLASQSDIFADDYFIIP